MPPPVGKGALSVAFVRPSVRPSVAYIANNSRTRMPSVPTFGMKVPHLRCDSRTTFEVKRSKVKVIGPINADTHRAPYLPNGKAYKFQTWHTDEERRPASTTGAMTSNVKDQGHTRHINGDTHRPQYLPNGKSYELQTWYTDGGRRPASATGAMASKVKGQGRKVT